MNKKKSHFYHEREITAELLTASDWSLGKFFRASQEDVAVYFYEPLFSGLTRLGTVKRASLASLKRKTKKRRLPDLNTICSDINTIVNNRISTQGNKRYTHVNYAFSDEQLMIASTYYLVHTKTYLLLRSLMAKHPQSRPHCIILCYFDHLTKESYLRPFCFLSDKPFISPAELHSQAMKVISVDHYHYPEWFPSTMVNAPSTTG